MGGLGRITQREELLMRIAQVAPLVEAVPPRLYGGTERVVSWLTEALVADGHDVTLFATGDSRTAAELVAVRPAADRIAGAEPEAVAALFDAVMSRIDEFDIVHFHTETAHFLPFRGFEEKCVTTLLRRAAPGWGVREAARPAPKAGCTTRKGTRTVTRPTIRAGASDGVWAQPSPQTASSPAAKAMPIA